MKHLSTLAILFILIAPAARLSAQNCFVNIVGPTPPQVCPGGLTTITANGTMYGANQSFNFNNSALPSGWSTSGSTNYGSLCGSSLDATPYFWASTAVGTPNITTAGFDICSGGTIVFDMRYAIQGGSVPCEGPDEQGEGVSLQYSVNGGATWIDIIYYSPWGFTLPSNPGGSSTISGATAYTSWSTFTVPIPPAAISSNTRFRWIQVNSSGSCCDNWGLDNIFINAGPCITTNIGWDVAGSGAIGSNSITVPVYSDTIIVAGMYDVNGVLLCQSAPIPVTVLTPYINGGPDQTVCQGEQVTLAGSNGSGFVWDNGVTNGVPFVPTTDTTYTVTGTDVNGCTDTDQVDIFLNSSNIYTLTYPNPAYCTDAADPGPTVSDPSLTGVYSVSPSSVQINSATGVIDLSTSTAPVSQVYTVSFDPSTYCYPTETVQVTINSLPIVNAGNDVTICSGATEIFSATGNAATYQWNNGVGPNGSGIIPPAGQTTYTVTGTSAAGCINSDSRVVTVNPNPNASIAGSTSVCLNSSQPVVTFTGSNSTAPYTFEYSVNGVVMPPISGTNQATVQVPTTTAGTFNFELISVTESSAASCSATIGQSATVVVWDLPVVVAPADYPTCDGAPTTLSGQGAVTYVWDHGVVNGASFVPAGTATYQVTGTDINGCQNTDNVVITVIPIPQVNFTTTLNEACSPLNTTVHNQSTGNLVNCQWILGDGTEMTSCDSINLNLTNAGCYDLTLIVSTPEGCTNQMTTGDYLCVYPNPVASFSVSPGELTSTNPIVTMTNSSTGADSYLWSFGHGMNSYEVNPMHEYPSDEEATYDIILVAMTDEGCVDTAHREIRVMEETIYYVPNAFSPDGDEYNNVFLPILTSGFDVYNYQLLIFNRWGELIFESLDYQQGWDGTYHGVTQKEGTYAWRINVKMKYVDKKVEINGHVNLLR